MYFQCFLTIDPNSSSQIYKMRLALSTQRIYKNDKAELCKSDLKFLSRMELFLKLLYFLLRLTSQKF